MDSHVPHSFTVIDGQGIPLERYPAESLAAEMKNSGAVILRNTNNDTERFTALTSLLAPGLDRDVAAGQGSLDFHGEIYYTPWPPDVLWFYCVQPAETDGQTLLCDGVQLLAAMTRESRSFFDNQPLVYEMAWPKAVWAAFFKTEDKPAILDYLKATPSLTATFDADTMRTSYAASATRQTKWGGEPAFVNSLLHALDAARQGENGGYGLRTEVPASVVDEVRELTDRLAYPIEWQKGDIAMIDNTRVMHARRPFGGYRELLAVNGGALF